MKSNGSQTSLQVSWDRAPGDVDSYLVQLLSSDSAVQGQTLSPNTTQAQFDHLTPGSTYQASIYTRRGELSNQVIVTATTGTSYVRKSINTFITTQYETSEALKSPDHGGLVLLVTSQHPSLCPWQLQVKFLS